MIGVWDPPIKQHVHSAFSATKKPYAEQAFTGLERALDRYVGEWTTATIGNCEATRIRGEQTEKVQAIRQLCLDQRLEGIRSLGQVLQDPTDALVEKADKAVWELEPIAGCASAAAIVDAVGRVARSAGVHAAAARRSRVRTARRSAANTFRR